jgi:polyisoprenoid-binding protein YceI
MEVRMQSFRVFAFVGVALIGIAGGAHAQRAPLSTDMAAGSYVLDPHHATLTARVQHQGFSLYTFRFTGLKADYAYDPANLAATKLSVTVDVNSIDTATGGDAFGKKFNSELTDESWLDAAKYPVMTFVSKSIQSGDGRTGKIVGDLTMHGVTRPVTLDVTFNGTGKGVPGGDTRAGFSAKTVVKRSDFGVAKYVPLIGDDVAIDIEVEFVRG